MKQIPLEADKIIRIVAAVIQNIAGNLLLVRKAGTVAFMQPGGKLEPGESEQEALAREIYEELGCSIVQDSFSFLGCCRAPAVNEPGWTVEAKIYRIEIEGNIQAAAEIADFIWFDTSASTKPALAPLTQDYVLPMI